MNAYITKRQRIIVLRRLHGLKWENPQKIQVEREELIIHIRLKKHPGCTLGHWIRVVEVKR